MLYGSISHDPVIMSGGREYGPYLASMLYGSISHDPLIMRVVESVGHILQVEVISVLGVVAVVGGGCSYSGQLF